MENKKRYAHVYQPNDLIYIHRDEGIPGKFQRTVKGPYPVLRTFPNTGTVEINNGGYRETVNLRRIIPAV